MQVSHQHNGIVSVSPVVIGITLRTCVMRVFPKLVHSTPVSVVDFIIQIAHKRNANELKASRNEVTAKQFRK